MCKSTQWDLAFTKFFCSIFGPPRHHGPLRPIGLIQHCPVRHPYPFYTLHHFLSFVSIVTTEFFKFSREGYRQKMKLWKSIH